MKQLFITCLVLLATAGIGYSQSAADQATLPYSPEQIANYIYECNEGTQADKDFIASVSEDLKIPAAVKYDSKEGYKKALNNWANQHPEFVEKFLIERRNYQQGNY